MKKHVINFFKIFSGISLAFVLFFVSLVSNTFATTDNNLNNYKVGNTNYIYDSFINNDLEYANGNISGSVEGNTFSYFVFNISNYKNSMSYINNFVLTIPYSLNALVPQSNNYEYNNYSVALYYFYTNDYSNITINNFSTLIESVTDSLNKETKIDNTYNDYINFTLDLSDNNTYLVFGYYSIINWDSSTTPTFTYIGLDFGFNYSMLNVFNGVNETNESLKQENQQLKNQVGSLSSENSSLSNNYTDLQVQYNILNNNYDTLSYNYNILNQQFNDLSNNTYTFDSLFWSIGQVPMGILLQTLNVNVLGINLAAIITLTFNCSFTYLVI